MCLHVIVNVVGWISVKVEFSFVVLPYWLSVVMTSEPSGCPNCTLPRNHYTLLSPADGQSFPSFRDVILVTSVCNLLVSVRSVGRDSSVTIETR
jgi:hypothetical protein